MSVQTPIYLDHHATTPLDPRVLEAMLPYFRDDFGNAASGSHVFGWRAEAAVELARESVARSLSARGPEEIVFTSGATESVNLALQGAVRACRGRDVHLVTAATEHRAGLDPCRALEAEGASLSVLPVDGQGLLDPDAFRAALRPETRLASVMVANNEIGVLQPIAELGAICRERGVLLHCDAAQAAGPLALDVDALGVDLLSLSGHKLYGPKGIGALYVRSRPRARIVPLLHGGGHERGLRPGTLPVPLVVGLGRALELRARERAADGQRMAALRDRLLEALRAAVPGVHLNGHPTQRLPGNLNLAFDDVEADALLLAVPELALSTGSACSSADSGPSHVLAALGLPASRIRGSIRIGLGRGTTEAEVDLAAERLAAAVHRLRSHSTLGARAGYPRPS